MCLCFPLIPHCILTNLFYCTVDAHVGRSLFEDALLGGLRNHGITVLLVTHAIHFLSRVDYIYAMRGGRVVESGTYEELMGSGGDFARFDKEYGGDDQGPQEHDEDNIRPGDADKVTAEGDMSSAEMMWLMTQGITIEAVKPKVVQRIREQAAGSGKLEGRLIVQEQRRTGSLSWEGTFFHLLSHVF